jgi:hypothetical protein
MVAYIIIGAVVVIMMITGAYCYYALIAADRKVEKEKEACHE